jgi:hypothetical protein
MSCADPFGRPPVGQQRRWLSPTDCTEGRDFRAITTLSAVDPTKGDRPAVRRGDLENV